MAPSMPLSDLFLDELRDLYAIAHLCADPGEEVSDDMDDDDDDFDEDDEDEDEDDVDEDAEPTPGSDKRVPSKARH